MRSFGSGGHLLAAAEGWPEAAANSGMPWWALVGMVGVCGVCALAGALWARQRPTRQLREARQDWRTLVQLSDTWVWRTDAEHRLTQWQPPREAPTAAWASVGRLGESLDSLFELQESLTQPSNLRGRLTAHAPIPGWRVASTACAPGGASGGPAWWLRGMPLWDDEGHFAGHLGTARPLLPRASAHAEEAVETDGEDQASFIYSISHDLRAPLRVVDGFARILKEDYGRFLDRIGNDHLDRVQAAAVRMNSMIDALLELSKLQSQPLLRRPVDLSQLAGFIVEDLQREAPERPCEVHIEPGIVAQGDPTLLRMALENLLGNAWKYSSQAPRTVISFHTEAATDGRRVLVVADQGAGFDMRFADRLFGVFQRLHSPKDFPGTGVGLASVRRILRRHGGDIWAESEVGKGARFYFTLG